MEQLRATILNKLSEAGLKITPQRMSVMAVLLKSRDHPTAESIYRRVLEEIPGISATTIYNTLDTFVEKKLIKRVKTDADIMRYEPVSEHHHHLYSSVSDRMEDYYDQELDSLLKNYFERKRIKNFTIAEIRLQVIGNFNEGSSQQTS